MPRLFIYRLNFSSPLHIGERGVGLEVTRTYVPADTLFGAICSAWRELYGVGALHHDVLDWFTATESGSEPFFLSSAFPFAGNIRFFPRPLRQLSNVFVAEDHEKRFKRVRFVSEGIFSPMIQGKMLPFEPDNCLNGGAVWATEEEKHALLDWIDEATGDVLLWKTAVVPRVTLDRITSASEIWHFGEVRFASETGLWFAVEFNTDHGDEITRKFIACLRLLGDTGLGGERGAGRGLFEISQVKDEVLPEINGSSQFVTLSPLCPKPGEVEVLTAGDASYELMPRRGWVTSPEASNLRRKMVWMFAEGSVLNSLGRGRAGRLVDATPETCPHNVWRYGYAFSVGVKT